MHKYERYIIYPLLIIALFYGMSGSSIIETSAENIMNRIVGKEVVIVNDKGQEVLNISSNDSGGATLSMSDDAGNQGITLATYKNGSNIIGVQRPNQDMGLFMMASRDASEIQIYGPEDRLLDNNGNFAQGTISVGVNNNEATLDIGDMSTNSQQNLGISIASFKKEDNNTILVGGNSGNGGVGMASNGGQNVQFTIYNEYGDELLSMGKTTDDEGGLWIYDDRGENEKYYGSY